MHCAWNTHTQTHVFKLVTDVSDSPVIDLLVYFVDVCLRLRYYSTPDWQPITQTGLGPLGR